VPTLVLIPTKVIEPVITQSSGNLPLTEAEVPRVPVDVAKAAFDTGQAIIVDVRSADAYAASHVKGAVNIQLGEIETNPSGLNLDKNQWIITYCT
jgi:rhodanese-related sulfurtransferase